MTKLRYFLLATIFIVFIYSCNSEEENTFTKFDHAAQALKDNDSLVKFLKSHYYDTNLDLVKPISANETSLFDDSKLKTQEVTENDINYKLYVYVLEEGTSTKGYPSSVDSVFVNYSGQRIVKNTLSTVFDQGKNKWFILSSVIKGWTYGLTNFKGGTKGSVVNGPLVFNDGGKGVLFVPSGLAYGNSASTVIGANENLIFYIDLYDIIKKSDTN